MRKKLSKVIALLLVMLLVLCSCQSKNEDTGKSEGVTDSNGLSTGKTDTAPTLESTTSASVAGTSDTSAGTSESTGPEVSDVFSPEALVGGGDAYTESFVADAGSSLKESYELDMMVDAYTDSSAAGIEGDYEYGFTDDAWEGCEMPIDEPYINTIQPGAHMLTAGEWNDNKNFGFIENLVRNGQDYMYSQYFKNWGWAKPMTRLTVACSAGTVAVENATVVVYAENGTELWRGKTDNNGLCYCFYNLISNEKPYRIVAETAAEKHEEVFENGLADDALLNIAFDVAPGTAKKLELMYMVDTTGSMGDEITFLQCELADVVDRVRTENGNIPVALSVNFYKDFGDAYVVRSNPFSEDIDSQVSLLMREYASGGGDWEEAVDEALIDAIAKHSWSEDATKILFLVLDAPPHNEAGVVNNLKKYLPVAAEKGIRIIPVAASGIDKDTEFLLRTFAMATGGTYSFLTNDSGIGGEHIEATVGSYDVEYLNDLMVRVIGEYLKSTDFVAQENYGLEGVTEQPVEVVDDTVFVQ